MPFRRAHEVVGAMVRRLLAEGRDFSALTMAEWREASEMFGEDAPRAATALASVQARRTPQSTNPEAVRAALDECRAWIKATSGFQVLGSWILELHSIATFTSDFTHPTLKDRSGGVHAATPGSAR